MPVHPRVALWAIKPEKQNKTKQNKTKNKQTDKQLKNKQTKLTNLLTYLLTN